MSDSEKLLEVTPTTISSSAAGLLKSGKNVITSEDQVTTLLHMRLKHENDRVEFENWLAGILKASQEWKKNAWSGRIVLRPPKNGSDYIVMFRFKTSRLMEGWLRSPERRSWLTKLIKLDIAETIDKDLQEGNVVLMPKGMENAAWSSLSGQQNITSPEITKKIKRQGPPPKWRSSIVVWISLQITVIPWFMYVVPALQPYEIPPYISTIIALIAIVSVVKWFLIPVLDRLLKCFLFGKPCPAVEPCLSCQKGCPCCRPGPKSNSADIYANKLQTLERQLQNTRRLNGAGRRRLLERIENIEQATFSNMENGYGNGKEEQNDVVRSETISTDIVVNESDALVQTAATVPTEQNSTSITSTTGDIAITVSIGYNVKNGCEVQFEEWLYEISRTAGSSRKA